MFPLSSDSFSAPPPSSPPLSMRPRARFGEFEVLGVLGKGGMASVALARSPRSHGLPDIVALKFLHPHLKEDADVVDAFRQEANLGMNLRHSSLCRTYFTEAHGGHEAIVMEYVPGYALSRLYRYLGRLSGVRPDHPEDELAGLVPSTTFEERRDASQEPTLRRQEIAVAQLILSLCRGLDVVHQARDELDVPLRAVHRDVTPQNIIVSSDGGVKLLDFGVMFSATRRLKTAKGIVKGKIGYLPPEYLLGRSWDHRVDIWSVGVLLWELLAARRLFNTRSTSEAMREICVAHIPLLSVVVPGISPVLSQLTSRALCRDVDKRSPGAREMANVLEEFLGSRGVTDGREALATWLADVPGHASEQEEPFSIPSRRASPERSAEDSEQPELFSAAHR